MYSLAVEQQTIINVNSFEMYNADESNMNNGGEGIICPNEHNGYDKKYMSLYLLKTFLLL